MSATTEQDTSADPSKYQQKPYGGLSIFRKAKEDADRKINMHKHYLLLFLVFTIIFVIFPLTPLIIFTIHSKTITASTNNGVIASEYFILFGFWIYFGIGTVFTELLKAIHVSKFVGFTFDNKKLSVKITKYKVAEGVYYISAYLCPGFIAFIPCMFRNTCFVQTYEMFVIIWNAIGLTCFIAFRMLRAAHILSYRLSTAFYFAKRANAFWTQHLQILEDDDALLENTFLSMQQLELWNDEYLKKPQIPIESITRRRAFFATMLFAISLPMITLILLIILPYDEVSDSPILIQLILIMFLLEVNVLILISQSALCNAKWEKCIKTYHLLLFDKKYEKQRKQNNIDFEQIISIYLPLYNYWKSQFFGLKLFGIRLDWKLFFKIFSLMFVNVAVYFVKSNIAHRLTF